MPLVGLIPAVQSMLMLNNLVAALPVASLHGSLHDFDE
jgi:hypothetical protein